MLVGSYQTQPQPRRREDLTSLHAHCSFLRQSSHHAQALTYTRTSGLFNYPITGNNMYSTPVLSWAWLVVACEV